MNSFFIWFEQRSGSSYLVSLLNSHPEINCRGELFGASKIDSASERQSCSPNELRRFRDGHYRRFLNLFPGRTDNPDSSQTVAELDSWFENSGEIRGFKFKHPAQAGLYPEILHRLLQLKNKIKILVLHRRNYLRRAISLMNMHRIQTAYSTSNVRDEISLPPLTVDPDKIVKLVKYFAASNEEFLKIARDFPNRMDVEYEQLAKFDQAIGTQLQTFLGVRQHQSLVATTQKITPHNLADAIQNLDQLRNALTVVGLAQYLEFADES